MRGLERLMPRVENLGKNLLPRLPEQYLMLIYSTLCAFALPCAYSQYLRPVYSTVPHAHSQYLFTYSSAVPLLL